MRRTLLPFAALLAAVALAGCELSLALDIAVDRSGGGTVELRVALDEDLHTLIEDAGVDPLRDLDAVQAREGAWDVSTVESDDGGLAVDLTASFDDPDGLEVLIADLHRGLDEHDPRLAERLRVERREGGAVAVTGRVGLIPPSTPGVRGDGVGFDEEAFRRLIDERGDEFVRYDVRVTLPADVVEHDGDALEARSVTWHAPVGEMRDIDAVSQRPGLPTALVVAAVALVAFAAAFLVGLLLRRRRGRRR